MKTKVIKMKNGQTRRVQVKANGQYKFLKGKATKAKPKTTKSRSVKTVATRRRRAPVKKRARRSKKYTTISLMDIGHVAVQYSNMTGQPLGGVLDQVTQAIIAGEGDILEIMMAHVQSGVQHITENPWGIAVKAAAIAFFVTQVKHIVGRKKIFTLGKFRVTS